MTLDFDHAAFRRELPGWAVRVPLCALPSAVPACCAFSRPMELAAMAAGVAGHVFAITWFGSWVAMQATPGRVEFVRSLKMAVRIKVGLLLVAACGLGAALGLNVDGFAWLMVGLIPDGVAAVGSMVLLSRATQWLGHGLSPGFGWVFSATLVQGLLVFGWIALLARIATDGARAWRWLTGREFRSARIWG